MHCLSISNYSHSRQYDIVHATSIVIITMFLSYASRVRAPVSTELIEKQQQRAGKRYIVVRGRPCAHTNEGTHRAARTTTTSTHRKRERGQMEPFFCSSFSSSYVTRSFSHTINSNGSPTKKKREKSLTKVDQRSKRSACKWLR